MPPGVEFTIGKVWQDRFKGKGDDDIVEGATMRQHKVVHAWLEQTVAACIPYA